jgi:hypothetical protein
LRPYFSLFLFERVVLIKKRFLLLEQGRAFFFNGADPVVEIVGAAAGGRDEPEESS